MARVAEPLTAIARRQTGDHDPGILRRFQQGGDIVVVRPQGSTKGVFTAYGPSGVQGPGFAGPGGNPNAPGPSISPGLRWSY